MIDPGWAAAGVVTVVNIVTLVVNHNRSSKDAARKEGVVITQLSSLCNRIDRLEQRFDEYFSKH